MESKYLAQMMTHLEKQREVLMDAYRSMSHKLHRLQIEESMLMQKFHEVMSAQALVKKGASGENASNYSENEKSGDSVCKPSHQT